MTIRFSKYILLLFIGSICGTPGFLFAQEDNTAFLYAQLNERLSTARKTMKHKDLAEAYYDLAEFEANQLFDFSKSFDHYANSLTYYRLINDTVKINDVQSKIAFRFKESSLYIDAIRIYEEQVEYYQSRKDSLNLMKTFVALSEVYKLRGALEKQQLYLDRAFKINESIKDTISQINLLLTDAERLLKFKSLDSALTITFDAFLLSAKVNNNDYKARALLDIGHVYKLKGSYDKAIVDLEEGLNLLERKDYDKVRLDFYKELSDVYEMSEDFKNAFKYTKKYAQLNDSILDQDRQVALNKANIRYQLNVKNKDIKNLEKENINAEEVNQQQRVALYILMTGFGLLLMLLYYSIRFYTQKIKTKGIISEQKAEINNQKIRELENQVKIKGMQSMIEGQELERERVAKDLHDSLGGLLSLIKLQFDSVKSKVKKVENVKEYLNANKLLDTAVEEIRIISRNMQPGALSNLGLIPSITDMINRFDGESYPDIDFQYYNIPQNLDSSVALSLYRIIQELLHNAIKHSKASEILIQLNRVGDELVLQIEDDGIGFDEKTLTRKGMGLGNIQSRVDYLKGSLEIDSQPGQGTSYLIHVQF